MSLTFFTKRPKLVAAFSFRYDLSLIGDYLINLGDCIDDFVAWDDRQQTGMWSHEGELRAKLRELAMEKKPDWLLMTDPDERLEQSAGKRIRKLIQAKAKKVYGFHFRELWTPVQYRMDGVWGGKMKWVLFPVLPGQEFMNLAVHCQSPPMNPEYARITTGLNLYHLKMIDPQNRMDRKGLYNVLDPERKIQAIGYDYLTDETNMRLETIPEGREYYPAYKTTYKIKQLNCTEHLNVIRSRGGKT
jgi:hypothetical protein